MGAARTQDIGVLTSSHLTNEALYQLGKLFRQEMKAANVGLLNGVAPGLRKTPGLAGRHPAKAILSWWSARTRSRTSRWPPSW
jgi:hypothetical protein